jgi:hypothetical protein
VLKLSKPDLAARVIPFQKFLAAAPAENK